MPVVIAVAPHRLVWISAQTIHVSGRTDWIDHLHLGAGARMDIARPVMSFGSSTNHPLSTPSSDERAGPDGRCVMHKSRRIGNKATETYVRAIIGAKLREGRIGRETAAARLVLRHGESDSELALESTAARIARALASDCGRHVDTSDESARPAVTIVRRRTPARK